MVLLVWFCGVFPVDAGRPPVDLGEAPVTVQTLRDRERALSVFASFVDPVDLGGLLVRARLSGRAAAEVSGLLVRYGQHLYNTGRSLGSFRTVILGVSDRICGMHVHLRAPWRAVRKWERLEPTQNRLPMPRNVWEAGVVVSLLIGRPRFACMLVLGFACLMRPGEWLKIRAKHVFIDFNRMVAFIAIFEHKTVARAGRQHVALRGSVLVRFLHSVVVCLNPDDLLFGGTPRAFRKVWDFVFAEVLDVPAHHGMGFTPACLRPGGATELYIRGVAVAEIKWLLRHGQGTSTEHYIQEAGVALTLSTLSTVAHARVAHFSLLMTKSLRKFSYGKVLSVQ